MTVFLILLATLLIITIWAVMIAELGGIVFICIIGDIILGIRLIMLITNEYSLMQLSCTDGLKVLTDTFLLLESWKRVSCNLQQTADGRALTAIQDLR